MCGNSAFVYFWGGGGGSAVPAVRGLRGDGVLQDGANGRTGGWGTEMSAGVGSAEVDLMAAKESGRPCLFWWHGVGYGWSAVKHLCGGPLGDAR